MANKTLSSGFLRSCEQFEDRPALQVSDQTLSYGDLYQAAASIGATLQERQPESVNPLTAVLAHRSVTAFAGILASLLRGHGYVPLNPAFPVNRLANILTRSTCESLIVGAEAVDTLGELLQNLEGKLHIYLPDNDKLPAFAAEFPQHTFVSSSEFTTHDRLKVEVPSMEAAAYLLFTSGSTGQPKGVHVSHASIRHFIDVMVERYDITEHDRLSQLFELVFDLSIFDMFVAWERGACLCCPSAGDARLPARFINESGITVWFSVPSLAVAMAGMRMLKSGLYPTLRLSLFCGEALRSDIVEKWAEAAPNSVIENLYGPTEVTLACTLYRWDRHRSPTECQNGLVPIGEAYPGMEAMIVDDELRPVADGEIGELLMAGPQVAIGYWQDPDKTAAAFVQPPGMDARCYRTGDLVMRRGPGQPILYCGRRDHQVKIRGNRIELGEIESVLRDREGIAEAVAIGWPRTEAGVEGIVAFIQSATIEADAALQFAAAALPSYMTPSRIVRVDSMPLNQNGKIDRKALAALLD